LAEACEIVLPLSEKLVLGIDVGTSGLKAIALGESGAVVGRAERS
jgi:sugar (pentulose or hexulose) kinase